MIASQDDVQNVQQTNIVQLKNIARIINAFLPQITDATLTMVVQEIMNVDMEVANMFGVNKSDRLEEQIQKPEVALEPEAMLPSNLSHQNLQALTILELCKGTSIDDVRRFFGVGAFWTPQPTQKSEKRRSLLV